MRTGGGHERAEHFDGGLRLALLRLLQNTYALLTYVLREPLDLIVDRTSLVVWGIDSLNEDLSGLQGHVLSLDIGRLEDLQIPLVNFSNDTTNIGRTHLESQGAPQLLCVVSCNSRAIDGEAYI